MYLFDSIWAQKIPLCRAPRGTSPYIGQAQECAAGMQDKNSYKREGKPLPYEN